MLPSITGSFFKRNSTTGVSPDRSPVSIDCVDGQDTFQNVGAGMMLIVNAHCQKGSACQALAETDNPVFGVCDTGSCC